MARRAHARGVSLGAGRRLARSRNLQRRAASGTVCTAHGRACGEDRRAKQTTARARTARFGEERAGRSAPDHRSRCARAPAPHRRRRAIVGIDDERRLAARRERTRSRDRSHRAVVARAGVRHRRALRVDASDDLQNWRNSGTATVLALEQQGARLERREIPLGGVRAKYLRLRRLDDGSAIVGLRAEARSVEHTRALPARAWVDAEAESDRLWTNLRRAQSLASTTHLWRRSRSISRASSSPATTRSRRSASSRARRTRHRRRGFDSVA